MKKALIISVALNLLIIIVLGAKRYYFSHSSNPDQNSYADIINNEKNRVLQQLPINKGDIVFVGTSITERFPINEMFGSIQVKNRGIGSNQTHHVLDRIAPIAKASPAKIFLEVGINDLANQVPEQRIMTNFRNIIDTIQKNSPATHIYIQTVLPTTGPDKVLMPGIIQLNKSLKEFCVTTGITLIDTYSSFERGNQMNKSLTTDGTHLNYEGYKKYMQVLRNYVGSGEHIAAN